MRRIEHKLGIHGSATCELQFNNTPGTLIGERRRGLSKYTMWLMNQARLGIAGQALGIAEAAYREADKYAKERMQFGKKIREMTQVYEMLADMKIAIEAGRTLYYETARIVDIKEGLDEAIEKHPERASELAEEAKRYAKYAGLLTPIIKAYNTEMSNKVAYDAIQIHGGTGYMQEFNAERHARDARITNIYEGTTQLQVVAALGGIVSGVAMEKINDYASEDYAHAPELFQKAEKLKNIFEKTVSHVKGRENSEYTEYHSRRLVEMCTDVFMCYLLLRDGKHTERKLKVAECFMEKASGRIEGLSYFILNEKASLLENYKEIIN